jgi:hypothetical protein
MSLFTRNGVSFWGISIIGLIQIYLFGLRHDTNQKALDNLAPSVLHHDCRREGTLDTPSSSSLSMNANPPIVLDSMVPKIRDALLEFQRQRRNQGRKATFLQIGANDGVTYDQLYPTLHSQKSDWLGLMVEPQPILYSQLVLLHADARGWSFYQGVVIPSCQNGTITFCETTTPGQGNFTTQGQLNGIKSQDDCKKHPGMVQVPRPCVANYNDLLEKGSAAFANATFHSNRWVVDVLQIDTEGKDYDLIQMIPPDLFFTCINFEHTYMGHPAKRPDYNATMEKLFTVMDNPESKMEYIRGSGDTLACRVKR